MKQKCGGGSHVTRAFDRQLWFEPERELQFTHRLAVRLEADSQSLGDKLASRTLLHDPK